MEKLYCIFFTAGEINNARFAYLTRPKGNEVGGEKKTSKSKKEAADETPLSPEEADLKARKEATIQAIKALAKAYGAGKYDYTSVVTDLYGAETIRRKHNIIFALHKKAVELCKEAESPAELDTIRRAFEHRADVVNSTAEGDLKPRDLNRALAKFDEEINQPTPAVAVRVEKKPEMTEALRKGLRDYINKVSNGDLGEMEHGRVLASSHVDAIKAAGLEAVGKLNQNPDQLNAIATELMKKVRDILATAPEAAPAVAAAPGTAPAGAPSAGDAVTDAGGAASGAAPAAADKGVPAATADAGKVEAAPRKPRMTDAQRIESAARILGIDVTKLREAVGAKSEDKPKEVIAKIKDWQRKAWDALTAEEKVQVNKLGGRQYASADDFGDGILGKKSKLALELASKHKDAPNGLGDIVAKLNKTPAQAEAPASRDTGTPEVIIEPTFKNLPSPRQLSVTPLIITSKANEDPETANDIKRGDILVARSDLKDGQFKVDAGDPVQVVETHPENTSNSMKGLVVVQTVEGYQASFTVDEFKGSTEKDVSSFDDSLDDVTSAMRTDNLTLKMKKGGSTVLDASKFGDKATHFAKIVPNTTIRYFGKYAVADQTAGNETVAIIGKGKLKKGEGYYIRTQMGAEGWVYENSVVDGSIVAKVEGEDMQTIGNRVADAADIKKREIAAKLPGAVPTEPDIMPDWEDAVAATTSLTRKKKGTKKA